MSTDTTRSTPELMPRTRAGRQTPRARRMPRSTRRTPPLARPHADRQSCAASMRTGISRRAGRAPRVPDDGSLLGRGRLQIRGGKSREDAGLLWPSSRARASFGHSARSDAPGGVVGAVELTVDLEPAVHRAQIPLATAAKAPPTSSHGRSHTHAYAVPRSHDTVPHAPQLVHVSGHPAAPESTEQEHPRQRSMRRSRSALPMTDTELRLIAAAASMGLRRMPSAG